MSYHLDPDKTVSPRVDTATRRLDGTYETSSEYFDSRGQLLQTQRVPGDGSGTLVFVNTRYDERGNTEAVSLPVVAAGAVGAGMIGVHTSTLSETTVVTDLLGRVTSRTEGVTGVGPGLATTSYTYDVSDNLVKVIDPAGKVTTSSYAWLGRRTSTTDPAVGTVATSFDNAHRPVTTTRASGSSLTRTYDVLGRVTKVTGKATSVSSPVILQTATFDTASRGKGLPGAVTTHTPAGDYQRVTTAYTNRGAPSNVTYTVPTPGTGTPASYAYSYTYDTLGRLATTRLPAVPGLPAETLTHGYTPTGSPATLTGTAAYVSDTTYRADHLLGSRTIGATTSGSYLVAHYWWDPQTLRIARARTAAGQPGTTATAVADDRFVFDAAGNLVMGVDAIPAPDVRTCHTYDSLNRLTHSWTTSATECVDTDTSAAGDGGYNTKWSYATAGDLTTLTRGNQATNYTYGAGAHAHAVTKTTTGTASTSYAYTPDGQQATKTTTGGTSPGTTTYEWDLAGNLSAATSTGTNPGTTSLAHTMDGTRLARTTGAGTTVYLPDQEITYPARGAVTSTRYYTHDGDTVAIRTVSTLTWQTSDRQGSVHLQLADGALAPTRIRYDPYGQPQSGTPTTDRSWLDKTTDPTTGLTHLGHRYYDTTLGRFLTPDPLADHSTTQTPNPYSYGANNPTHYTDPDGLLPTKPWLDDGYAPPKAKAARRHKASAPARAHRDVQSIFTERATTIRVLDDAGRQSARSVRLLSGAPSDSTTVGGHFPEAPKHDAAYWVAELSGWNDIRDCFGGSLAACGWTAAMVLPVGRAAKAVRVGTVTHAATGGAAAVRTGQAGEAAVRSVYDIGPKASAEISGRTRTFDGLTDTTVSEVKNVARQSYTLQLRDSLSYAQSTGRTFDLYVRPETYLTRPLRDAIARGDITLRFIP